MHAPHVMTVALPRATFEFQGNEFVAGQRRLYMMLLIYIPIP
jgi:hypothetical protein